MRNDCGSRETVRAFSAALIVTLILTLFLAGCGRNSGVSGISAVQSTVQRVDCPVSGTTDITVQNEQFSPVTVTIAVNDVVKWSNTGGGTWYWVTSENVPGGSFNIPAIKPGESACLEFTAPGTYAYHCDPNVGGTVIVSAPTKT